MVYNFMIILTFGKLKILEHYTFLSMYKFCSFSFFFYHTCAFSHPCNRTKPVQGLRYIWKVTIMLECHDSYSDQHSLEEKDKDCSYLCPLRFVSRYLRFYLEYTARAQQFAARHNVNIFFSFITFKFLFFQFALILRNIKRINVLTLFGV